ncbi:MAG: NUDIX hydrolase [Myxococcota bacterium]
MPLEIKSDESPPAEPRDAATVVLLRDASAALEVFLVKRHRRSGFMASAHVFPGGVVEPFDESADAPRDFHTRLGLDDSQRAGAFFVAAARETLEESGVLLGSGDAFAAMHALNAGTPLDEVSQAHGVRFDLSRLAPLSRWVTPAVERRRYDTFFFLCEVNANEEATFDGRETVAGEWWSPEAALNAGDAGKILLAPPTHHTLLHLTAFRTAAEAIADSNTRVPPPLVAPIFAPRGPRNTPTLVLPGDPDHPESNALPGPVAYELVDGAWRAVPRPTPSAVR